MNNFISDIKIDKVRHLKNLEIKLSVDERKHLILTGKNGSGKTSVLNFIMKFLKSIESGSLSIINTQFQELNGYKLQLDTLQSIEKRDEQEKLNKENLITKVNTLESKLSKYGYGICINFNTDASLISKYKQGKFILSYFDSNRSTNVNLPNTIKKIDLKDNYKFEDKPSINFVEYLVDLKTQQSFARNEGDEDVAEKIDTWFDNFENALKEIFEDDTLKLKFNYRNYDFKIFEEGREPFGFDVLSDGYSSVLNIVMDLILRMEKQRGYYSENEDRKYIYDIEGIVLIDEIETHLHIDLQKKIMPFLIKLFPKIQFIISTHSPFVLSSVENAVIYDLGR